MSKKRAPESGWNPHLFITREKDTRRLTRLTLAALSMEGLRADQFLSNGSAGSKPAGVCWRESGRPIRHIQPRQGRRTASCALYNTRRRHVLCSQPGSANSGSTNPTIRRVWNSIGDARKINEHSAWVSPGEKIPACSVVGSHSKS